MMDIRRGQVIMPLDLSCYYLHHSLVELICFIHDCLPVSVTAVTQKKTSGQSKTTGRIAAAHGGRLNGIRRVALVCTPQIQASSVQPKSKYQTESQSAYSLYTHTRPCTVHGPFTLAVLTGARNTLPVFTARQRRPSPEGISLAIGSLA